MAGTAAHADTPVQARMATLAHFVALMDSEEIWAFLDALFPGLPEDAMEDLFGRVLAHANDEEGARPAEDVFAEIEAERGLLE
jgi:hypothetical protein